MLSCNKLTTEYQTLDLGKVNYSNSISGELNASLSTGLTGVVNPTSSTVSKEVASENNNNVETTLSNGLSNTNTTTSAEGLYGKLTAARSFAEEVMLKQCMVNLNASIYHNKLNLYQESISGLDLTGNIMADIAFHGKDVAVKKVYSFSNLISAGTLVDVLKIKVKEMYVTYYNFANDIQAVISFQTDYRHVEDGHTTISESDDKVVRRFGESRTNKQFILIRAIN